MYTSGCQPQLKALYPTVAYPVNGKAAAISPLIMWDHSTSWLIPKLVPKESFGEIVIVNISDNEWSYLQGHELDGRTLMPASSLLVCRISLGEIIVCNIFLTLFMVLQN